MPWKNSPFAHTSSQLTAVLNRNGPEIEYFPTRLCKTSQVTDDQTIFGVRCVEKAGNSKGKRRFFNELCGYKQTNSSDDGDGFEI